jgi:hypothetical protein
MVIIEPRPTPAPRYKGTVVCTCCHAEYAPGNWWIVSYDDGTSGRRTWRYPLPAATCPICRTPQS